MIETLEDLNAKACCCTLHLCPQPIMLCEYVQAEKTASADPTLEEIEAFDGTFGLYAPWVRPAGAGGDELPVIYRKKAVPQYDPADQAVLYNGSFWHKNSVTEIGYRVSAPSTPVTVSSGVSHMTQTYVNAREGDGTGVTTTVEAQYVEIIVVGGNSYIGDDLDPPDCTSTTGSASYLPGPSYEPIGYTGWVEESPRTWNCTATRKTYTGIVERATYGSPTPPETPTCPGPWGNTDEAGGDITATQPSDYQELGDSFSRSDLEAKTLAALPSTWPSPPDFVFCESAAYVEWPTIDDATPSGGWPTCEDSDPPTIIRAYCQISKSRFRFQIPSTFDGGVFHGTYFKFTYDILREPANWDKREPIPPDVVSPPGTEPEALIDNPSHAEWEADLAAWDSPIGTPFPGVEPAKRITNPAHVVWSEAQAAYLTYLAADAAYDIAVTLWNDWLESNPGWSAPLRTFVSEDNVLTWTGPGSGAADDPSRFTNWVDLPPPDVSGIENKQSVRHRVVNIRFSCRENWFIGEVPQVTGEAVNLPDP